ncbi:MAG: cupin domain-containing protein [Gemmatimonadetes bacterium]|nr:cupin domain-containing protein [Gemmatimonadota bacterium]
MGRHGQAGKTRRGSAGSEFPRAADRVAAKKSTGVGVVKSAKQVELSEVKAGKATRFQVLVGPDDGAPNFVLRRFVMGQGGGMPKHTNEVEHEQYVLRGRARILVGDRTHEVGPDDSLYIPAGTPHSYDVIEAPFEFLCVVPNRPDQIRIADDKAAC